MILELSIPLNGFMTIIQAALQLHEVLLSIPLNGFYGCNKETAIRLQATHLSIPLNGFLPLWTPRSFWVALHLSIPLNGFLAILLSTMTTTGLKPFQFHWMDSPTTSHIHLTQSSLSIPLNGFTPMLYDDCGWSWVLSIPLNGFRVLGYPGLPYKGCLSIPLNGFS